tara:strand:+ start:2038 stop:2397 length:360 start_codon:yes stop_codon:yes gene_type:complete
MDKILLEKMRKVYTRRLLEALSEVDVVDKEGNVLISRDLKVFHKDSGYEYTVDDVLRGPDGIKVVLRKPDKPRLEPEPATTILDEIVGEIDAAMMKAQEDEDDFFVVDEESFKKEYEVK